MKAPFNRYTGLIVLDVTMSNPNGDPDMESDPRQFDADGRGFITPVSFKRKLRDLVSSKGPVFEEAKYSLDLREDEYEILEERGRNAAEIGQLSAQEFTQKYWDARLFGNTFLEEMKNQRISDKNKDVSHFIRTGVIQIGVGQSIAPIEIERLTLTNKSGVQADKDRGMAPLGFRVVRHGIYTIPIFINPSIAVKTGATQTDLALFQFLIPYVYQHTASAIRPQVEVLHAWFAEHKNPLGSCPDHLLIDALTPTLIEGVDQPSNKKDYQIPGLPKISDDILGRFERVEDLCLKTWP